VPLLLMPPPAPPVDMLPERVELVTVRMPELSKAPPLPGDFAPETVTPEMERLPPVLMVKILKPPAIPLMISEEAPGPVMVRVPAVPPVIAVLALIIVGNAAVKAMVPVTPVLKTISSLPGVVLARVMASLSEIPESPSTSEVVVTVIGAGTILPSSWRSWGGAGSSCFSILGVAKESAESI